MAPIQVVELDAVPNELKARSHSRASQQSDKSRNLYHYYGYQNVGPKSVEIHVSVIAIRQFNHNYFSYCVYVLQDRTEGKRVVKTKYGAWYLPKKLWKLRQWDEVCISMVLLHCAVKTFVCVCAYLCVCVCVCV